MAGAFDHGSSSDMRPSQHVGPIGQLTDSDKQTIRKNCDSFLQALLHENKLIDSGKFSSLSTFLEAPFMYEKAKEMLKELASRKKEAKKSRVARDFGEKILAEQLDRVRVPGVPICPPSSSKHSNSGHRCSLN